MPITVDGHFDALRKTLSIDLDTQVSSIAYHYTRADAAKKIVESGKVWATDVAFLNDPTEWSHGHELIMAALETKGVESPEYAEGFDDLKQSVAGGIERQFKGKPWYYLVASLSTVRNGDHLDLWRWYGDNGKGCSVGIDLAQCPGPEVPGAATLSRMIYDDEAKRRLALRAVSDHIDSGRALTRQFEKPEVWSGLRRSLKIHAGIFASCCKRAEYVGEQEVRLVRAGVGPIFEAELKYRRSALFDRVPYVELDLRPAIVEVVLGPCHPPDGELRWNAWLRLKGLRHVRVRRSDAPYRA